MKFIMLRRRRIIFGSMVALIGLWLAILPVSGMAQTDRDITLPYASSPTGEFSGTVVSEFEMRDMVTGEEIEVRKFMFRLGWTPVSYASLWVEGGVANLTMKTDSSILQGDYGTSAGGGFTAAAPWVSLLGFYPFVSGRGTMFISRLMDDRQVRTGFSISRRSKYQWQELSAVLGLGQQTDWGIFYFGVAGMNLEQDEWRNTRSNNNYDQSKFNYKSGFKPGVTVALTTNLGNRFHIQAGAEVYDSIVRVTISIGQWGLPYMPKQ